MSVQIELSQETLQELRRLAEDHEVEDQEAIRMALEAGIHFFAAEHAIRLSTATGGHEPEEVERLLTRHLELEADYPVLKHRLWLAMQDNQAMSLREGALTATIAGLKGLVERLRGELADVREQARAAAGPARPASEHAAPRTPGPRPDWRQRLCQALRRKVS